MMNRLSSVYRRLSGVYGSAQVIPFNSGSKFIIMSDCHRGQGNTCDNFLQNQTLHLAALEYYYKKGFTYIELGDGDELWENRRIEPIINAHSDIFCIMSKFYNKSRMYVIYGNHDIAKKRRRVVNREFVSFYCDGCEQPLFPNIHMHEGLILENTDINRRMLLVHGHQGDFLNDTIWPVARFLVRYLWGPLELIGFTAPTAAAGTQHGNEAISKKLASYANSQRLMLIAGHTHRPYYSKPGEGLYFNDGSCVHPRSITGVEIQNNTIALVKWSVSAKEDLSLYVNRQIPAGPDNLEEFYR